MLADADGSVRVSFGGSELQETGDSEHLLAELLAHVGAREELGRSAASDWRSNFLPVDGDPRSDAPYRVDRIHYTQIATLQDP